MKTKKQKIVKGIEILPNANVLSKLNVLKKNIINSLSFKTIVEIKIKKSIIFLFELKPILSSIKPVKNINNDVKNKTATCFS